MSTLNVTEIRVKRNPINDRWGIYRVYRNESGEVQEMLWTTSMIRRGAVKIAQTEAKKFGAEIKVASKYA